MLLDSNQPKESAEGTSECTIRSQEASESIAHETLDNRKVTAQSNTRTYSNRHKHTTKYSRKVSSVKCTSVKGLTAFIDSTTEIGCLTLKLQSLFHYSEANRFKTLCWGIKCLWSRDQWCLNLHRSQLRENLNDENVNGRKRFCVWEHTRYFFFE